MFAIVDIAGFQEKVQQGDVLTVPLLETEKGKSMTFSNVLLLVDGDAVSIGSPYVAGASVEAEIVEHGRGEKIRVVKFRHRKRHTNVKGHRQYQTTIRVTGIKK